MSLCSPAKVTRLKCQHEMSSGLASQSVVSSVVFLFNYWCKQGARWERGGIGGERWKDRRV